MRSLSSQIRSRSPNLEKKQRTFCAIKKRIKKPKNRHQYAITRSSHLIMNSIRAFVATSSTMCLNNDSSLVRRRQERTIFFMFLKILLKSIEQSGDRVLSQQVRSTILTCTRRNRMGDPHFSPLDEVLEEHLRQMVGELNWAKAKDYQRVYLTRNMAQDRINARNDSMHRSVISI